MNKINNLRYLIIGSFNTVFSYVLSILIYHQLKPYIHLLLISIITYALAISLSFFTYKYFFFKTKGKLFIEYLRFYLVYGLVSLVCILCLWIMVSFLFVEFWIAQGIVLLVAVSLTYFGNKKFAFNVQQ